LATCGLGVDDERVERQSGLASFDTFASTGKTLHANPARIGRYRRWRSTARPVSSFGISYAVAQSRATRFGTMVTISSLYVTIGILKE